GGRTGRRAGDVRQERQDGLIVQLGDERIALQHLERAQGRVVLVLELGGLDQQVLVLVRVQRHEGTGTDLVRGQGGGDGLRLHGIDVRQFAGGRVEREPAVAA